jgi:rhodanese-related sulfurtransferase
MDAGLPVDTGTYMEVPPDLASRMIDLNPELVVVDVSPLYADGHLPGAIHAPLRDLDSIAAGWDPSVPHLVYCHSRQASEEGAGVLVDMGFEIVYRLRGEYGGWVEAGYAVEAPAPQGS